MLIPTKRTGRPRTQIDNALTWLRKTLADGPKPLTTIRKGAVARGDSWATIRRCKKELQVVNVFYDGKHWWALPGQLGSFGPSAQAAPPEEQPVEDTFENLAERMHREGRMARTFGTPLPEIESNLRQLAYHTIETKLPENQVEALVSAIAVQYQPPPPPIPAWDAPDPAQAIRDTDNLSTLYAQIRAALWREETAKDRPPDLELMGRLRNTLELWKAERQRRRDAGIV
jgi:hypothetical protein